MPQDRIHLVLSCDDNFAQHAGVLMQSLLRTAAHPNRLVFHLINGGIQPVNLQKIQAIVSSWSAQLDLLHIDQQRFSHLFLSHQYSLATYYRLIIGELLPAEISRCIYLDCDMVALSDIEELWETDLQGRPLGAVIDHGLMVSAKNFQEKQRDLGLSDKDLYFNAGLLLLDLAQWRQLGLDSTALSLASSRAFRSHDQDVLNLLFKGNWTVLHTKWNCMPAVYGFSFRLFRQLNRFPDVAEARRHPAIIHYAGRYKPWEFDEAASFNGAYFKSIKETPFGPSFQPQRSPQNVGRSLRSELFRIALGNLFYSFH